jgi:tetratricopeptide (TPR) repeat protein
LLLQAKRKWQEAAEQYEIVIRDGPESFNSHFYLAEVLQHLGRPREAVSHLREVVRTNPDAVEALNNLAWALASSNDPEIRNGAEAVRLAKRACQITEYRATVLIGTLAAAYAEAGRFEEAVATAQKACALASKAKDQTLLKRNQELLELYRAGQPYHEPARTP